ncbi:DUF1746-domain-containing protein [Poronia punctata]|nr:DUF1746-domain-containing protein [Poronia punctata]
MNNDPSPTSPADPSIPLNQHYAPDNDIRRSSVSSTSERAQNGSAADQDNASLSQPAKEGLSKKLQFLTGLALNLDTLVYAELCTIYYMDCSFFRLFIRWMAQTLFASPKTEDSVLIVPNYHVSAIVAPNLLCIFLHLISSPPEAGEALRGYLHGGVLFDFIGQKPPSSRFTLILLDVVVLAIQCFMITVNIEKEKIRNTIKPPRTNRAPGFSITAPIISQDHDAEERGVLRDAPIIDDMNETDDIEMRPLQDPDDTNVGEDGREGTRPPGRSSAQRRGQLDDLIDVLRSGNGVLANFHIPQLLRTAWHSRETRPEGAAVYALQNVGYNATLAALAARRRARLTAVQRPS